MTDKLLDWPDIQLATLDDPADLDEATLDETGGVVWRAKDPRTSGLEEMEDNLLRVYKTKVAAVIDRLADIGLPQPGEQFRLITRRSFNAIEMLEYIARQEPIVELKMAVFSINYYAAKILLELIDSGRIQQTEILMSNLRNAAHREKEEIIKRRFADHPSITLWFCSSHAKLMACRTASGQHYVIEGSGNHAYNSRVEQYVIDNDPKIYQFTVTWMEQIQKFLAGRKELIVL